MTRKLSLTFNDYVDFVVWLNDVNKGEGDENFSEYTIETFSVNKGKPILVLEMEE